MTLTHDFVLSNNKKKHYSILKPLYLPDWHNARIYTHTLFPFKLEHTTTLASLNGCCVKSYIQRSRWCFGHKSTRDHTKRFDPDACHINFAIDCQSFGFWTFFKIKWWTPSIPKIAKQTVKPANAHTFNGIWKWNWERKNSTPNN